MKRLLSLLLSLIMTLTISIPGFAGSNGGHIEQFSVSQALSNPEIVDFLEKTGELQELYQAQEEIRDLQYEKTAGYANDTLGTNDISADEVRRITQKYNLQVPAERTTGIIDNGTINVERNVFGDSVDIWYLFIRFAILHLL